MAGLCHTTFEKKKTRFILYMTRIKLLHIILCKFYLFIWTYCSAFWDLPMQIYNHMMPYNVRQLTNFWKKILTCKTSSHYNFSSFLLGIRTTNNFKTFFRALSPLLFLGLLHHIWSPFCYSISIFWVFDLASASSLLYIMYNKISAE